MEKMSRRKQSHPNRVQDENFKSYSSIAANILVDNCSRDTFESKRQRQVKNGDSIDINTPTDSGDLATTPASTSNTIAKSTTTVSSCGNSIKVNSQKPESGEGVAQEGDDNEEMNSERKLEDHPEEPSQNRCSNDELKSFNFIPERFHTVNNCKSMENQEEMTTILPILEKMCSEKQNKRKSNINLDRYGKENSTVSDDEDENCEDANNNKNRSNEDSEIPLNISLDNQSENADIESKLSSMNAASQDETVLNLSKDCESVSDPTSEHELHKNRVQDNGFKDKKSDDNLYFSCTKLFNLHERQQYLQIQFLREIQHQLKKRDQSTGVINNSIKKFTEDANQPKAKTSQNENSTSCFETSKTKLHHTSDDNLEEDEQKSKNFQSELKEELMNNANEEKSFTADNTLSTKESNPDDEEKQEQHNDPHKIPLCNINSTLASSIITNHDPSPPPSELNSLEMLQKRTQEVLDSASQSLLANNLIDDFAYGSKDSQTQDGKLKSESLFRHRCRYCGKIFGSDSALQIHIRSHTGERPFKCNVCGSKFTTKGNLKVHYQRHTQKYPIFPVAVSTNDVPSGIETNIGNFPSVLPRHLINSHSSGRLFHPGITFLPSGAQFPSFLPTAISENSVSQNEENDYLIEQEQDEPTDLSISSKRYNLNENSLNDRNSQNNNETKNAKAFLMEVEQENRSMEYPSEISIDSMESDLEQSENFTKKSYRSSISRNSSISDSTVEMSINSTTNMSSPPQLTNDVSWESLIEIDKTSETSKLQHLVDNIENKLTDPNQCIFCQRIMSCRSALQMHLRTHTGERPYRCRICGRAFATKGNLKAHMSIHKIKPPVRSHFKCPVCHQKFSSAFVLQQHLKTHTMEDANAKTEVNNDENADDNDYGSRHYPNEESNKVNIVSDDSDAVVERKSQRLRNFKLENQNQNSNSSQEIFRNVLKHERQFDEGNTLSSLYYRRNFFKEVERPGEHGGGEMKYSESEENDIEENTGSLEEDALDLTKKAAKETPVDLKETDEDNSLRKATPTNETLSGGIVIPMMPLNPFQFMNFHGNTTCGLCFKTFACNSALEIHFRSHSKERPFKCNVCDKAFSTKTEEVMHSLEHYKVEEGNMRQHMLTHNSKQKRSSSKSEKRHPTRANKVMEDLDLIKSQDSILSPTSSFSPSSSSSLSSTSTSCHPNVNMRNDEAGNLRSFNPMTSIEQHLPKIQFVSMLNNSNGQHEPSNFIEKSPLSIDNHHHDRRKEENRSDFIVENYSHELNEAHQDKEKVNSTNLSLHDEYGSSNNKHFCIMCKRNFSSSSALQIHMRIHTGDKPFQCPICQKAFTTKGNLKVHMGIHMWTHGNSSSRRGRRMSLEYPLGENLNNNIIAGGRNVDVFPYRLSHFYPYIPPFANGMPLKVRGNKDLETFSPLSYVNTPLSRNYGESRGRYE